MGSTVGGGAGSTDILILIYKITTGQSPQFSIAAALDLDYLPNHFEYPRLQEDLNAFNIGRPNHEKI